MRGGGECWGCLMLHGMLDLLRAQLIPLLFRQKNWIRALDRYSTGRNATLKESDGRRVGWAETMESGSYL